MADTDIDTDRVAADAATAWTEVCELEHIVVDTGVCALVAGRQVAVFRLRDGSVHAISNVDPFSGAGVLSRGIVGDRRGVAMVASPLYKQAFDLRTGECLDDPSVAVPVHDVLVSDGVVLVSDEPLT
ncbi:MAG: nitrite reductase small subunit NirD [Actinomycetota bacterium]|nr:nitrite reductase small subunit NirD [Actinomycetota bacterium]